MNNLKKSDTVLRVGKLLLELLNRSMSYDEMLTFLEKESKIPVYTTEVLNKYLNTLRALGFEIKRDKGKYTLVNFLVNIELTDREKEVFKNIEKNILKYGTIKNIRTFYNFKRKVLKFFDTESQNDINHYTPQILTNEFGMKIKQFEQLCDDEQIIKIQYISKIFAVEPRELLFIDNKVYLECYVLKTMNIRKLLLDKVVLIEQMPSKNKNIDIKSSFMYEISGRLAEIYKLKEGEIVISNGNGKLLIKNDNEDYELLAKRLIRYKDNCKILKPKEFVNYFKNYTDEILAIYGKH